MSEPVRVGHLLPGLPGLAERLAEARLVAAWPQIAGAAAGRSRAESIEGGWLHVSVETSGWLHRLTVEAPRLTEQCRALLDIRGIRFRLVAPAAPEGGGSR